jgi:uncharacterized protein (DUF885 family)
MLTRRAVLATAAAAPALAAFAPANDADAKFYALLDTMKDEPLDVAAQRARQTTDLLKLRVIDRRALSTEAQLDYDSILEGLGLEAILRSRFPFGATGATISPYIITQRWGGWTAHLHVITPQTATEIEAETARFEAEAALGVLPPAPIFDAILKSLSYGAVVADTDVGSATAKQVDALKKLRPKAPTDVGVWRLKDGDAYYAQALKIGTSLNIDPATALAMGEQMVADLNAEADAVLRRLDLTAGTVAERIGALIDRGTGRYSADDQGRAQAVADMTAQLARARPAIAPHFDELPKGAIAIALTLPGHIGFRIAPSYDGTKPGAYYVDLADPVQGVRYRPAWTLPTVVHHETLPGHLLQLPLQEHAAPHPALLRYTPNAFFEGWAIYAERLAAEIGLLEHDLDRLGFLQSLLVRAARLVVDTGIHFRRWSRDEAIARFKAISVFALNPIEDEVDRIIVEPGATCGPALGYLTLMDLRARIRARTTNSDKDFHTTVLKRGALRLTRLDWIVHQELALPP